MSIQQSNRETCKGCGAILGYQHHKDCMKLTSRGGVNLVLIEDCRDMNVACNNVCDNRSDTSS